MLCHTHYVCSSYELEGPEFRMMSEIGQTRLEGVVDQGCMSVDLIQWNSWNLNQLR